MKSKKILFILIILPIIFIGSTSIYAWDVHPELGDLAEDDYYPNVEIEPDTPSKGIISFVDNLYLIFDIIGAIIFLAFIAVALATTSNGWNIEQYIILGLSSLIFILSNNKLLLIFIGLGVAFISMMISRD